MLKVNAVRREQWRAKPPTRPLKPDWNFDSIVVHYTGHERYHSMLDIQNYDFDHHNWDDIAYHYGIFQDGSIHEGRKLIFEGSHVILQNTRKIGIVCIGDFDRNWRNLGSSFPYSGEQVPKILEEALLNLSMVLKSYFPIIYFGGHIEYGKTKTCPGSNLLPIVDKIRQKINLQKPIYREF